MSEPQPPDAPAPRKRPFWQDPFVIAFAIGVVVLTALPSLQRLFLKAPPPISALPAWSLPGLADGGEVSSASFKGKVLLLELVPGPGCDAACLERQRTFGNAVGHTDDLGGLVHLVTLAAPGTEEALAPLVVPGSRWHLAVAEPDGVLVRALREGWWQWAHTDAGATGEDFAHLPAVILVDQDNALRGFWKDDPAGRGNAINGARLLAKHGAKP